jgi:hypothetical protein
VFSFEELVAHLNQSVVTRLAEAIGKGEVGRGLRTYPTFEDFGTVRELARGRSRVWEGLGEGVLRFDRFGMIRGDVA